MYTTNDWIKEEKEAIKNKCACSVAVKKLREKEHTNQVDLDECPCNLKHTRIMGHCIVCGAKIPKQLTITITK